MTVRTGAQTITFDEFSERPLDGVSVKGATFSFTGASPDIPVALFGSSMFSFADTGLMTAPWAVGATVGTLRVIFNPPISRLSFDVGLTASVPLPQGFNVRTFQGTQLIDKIVVPTSPPTSSPFSFSEAHFAYTSIQNISAISVTFDATSSAQDFAFDNLSFTSVPEPSTIALASVGALCFLRRRWR